jgi:hypothetical protein
MVGAEGCIRDIVGAKLSPSPAYKSTKRYTYSSSHYISFDTIRSVMEGMLHGTNRIGRNVSVPCFYMPLHIRNSNMPALLIRIFFL